ncbi:MAG: histidine kinase [Verrucomicrobiae bacterium]|nr:histidine kinase [Verrucomicrobiae bacterium]
MWGLLFAGIFTLLGLAFAGQLYLTQIKVGQPVTWAFALTRSLGDWYAFALLSLPVMALARRFPLGSAPAGLLLVLHLTASGVFALLWTLLRAGLAVVVDGIGFAEALRHALVATLVFNMLVYWVIVVAAHAVAFYRQSQDRERRGLELERRLAEARLQALQMQLNPHFLFNALQGISTLMYRDVEAADRMLIRLSELLRQALDRSGEHAIPLRDELEFLDRYLEIEQIRFGDHLSIRRELDPSLLGAPVPNLILQPLVENAIKHGIEPQVRPGVITLRAQSVNADRLRLEVEDNGVGIPPGGDPPSGIGLANCRTRLRHLYGDNASLSLRPGGDRGLCVIIELPRGGPTEPLPAV